MTLSDPTKIDPSRIPDDQWEYEGPAMGGTAHTFIYWIDKENGTYFRKTVNVIEEDLIKQNQDSYFDSKGQRFGDGKVVSRIPLNIFYRDIAPRLREGDMDYLKWWNNHEDNRPYRTFRGKV